MTQQARILLLLTVLALSGCFRSDQDRAVTTDIGKSGLNLVSYTGTTRGAYIWPADGGRHVCAEPPPDLGLTTAREISANLKAAAQTLGNIGAPSVDAGGAAKLSSAAIELAGRSQIVLLTREFLYRECELAANFEPGTPGYDALAEQYRGILDVVVKLADAEKSRAAAELIAIQVEAGRLNQAQDADIARVIAHVTASDGSIDRNALKTLLDTAKVDPSFRTSIESRASLADLVDYLQIVPDAVTQALAAAIPKEG
jgi:hypothetical protein